MFDYIRDPKEIYRRSFEIIRAETDLSGLPEAMDDVAIRIVHAAGTPELVGDLVFSAEAAGTGRQALKSGAPVLVDTEMLSAGIIRNRLPAGNEVICTLKDPQVAGAAAAAGTTRSSAAVDLWRPRLKGAVVAIGNAPTALFRLLELLGHGIDPPALIVGFPVGFVGAAESKDALVEHAGPVPYITLRGRRGGSTIAAAAINALAGEGP